MDWNRKLSLIISSIYLALAVLSRDMETIFITLACLAFCLGCIWFGEEMGGYTSPSSSADVPPITKETPGIFIIGAGWVFLLLPIFVFAMHMLK